MGYRGSKSIVSLSKIKNTFVKEQRVDGSYFGSILYPKLRCTLMGGESRYQISNPSKQLNISPFTTLINKENLSNSTPNLDP